MEDKISGNQMQMIEEIKFLKARIRELEDSELKHKGTEEALLQNEKEYRDLFQNMPSGFAFCKIILDSENKPVDFFYLDVNEAFERITGLKKEAVIGKKVTEAIPATKNAHPELLDIYGKVALTGEGAKFDIYFKPFEIWLSISAYSPKTGYFIVVFEDMTTHKEAERLLRESEERYRSLVENVNVGISLVSPERKIIMVNSAMARMIHKPASELIGKKCFEEFEKRGGICSHCPGTISMATGKSAEVETRGVRDDGSSFDVHLTTTPVFGVEGKPNGYIEVVEDITERKKVQEDIKNAKLFTESSLNAMQDVFYAFDLEGKVLLWNSALKKETGYTDEEISLMKPTDFFEGEDVQRVREAIEKVFKEGFAKVEADFVTKDKRRTPFELDGSMLKNSRGELIGLAGSGRNLTERRKIEEDHRRLLAILENTTDFVSMKSPDQKVLFLNKAGRRMVGIGENDDISHLQISNMHPQWAGDIIINQGLPVAIRDGVWSGEVALRHHHDEREIPVLQVLIAHKSADGKLEYLSTIMRDITERKKHEEQLNDAYDKLKQAQNQLIQSAKMASLGLLSAGMAHEINNPAFAILGEAQMLLEDQAQDAAACSAAKIILEQAHRIAQITGRFSEYYSRKEARPQPVDVNAIVEKTISLLGYQEKIGEVKIVKELDVNLPKVVGDENQLQEVFSNIMLNAVQAMQGKGTLTVKTASSTITERVSDRVNKDRMAVIEIRDTGLGMEGETMNKLFSPFFTTREKGMGLGLFLSYGIISNHGGAIEAQSKVGEGTVFSIKLPIPDKEERA